MYRIAKKFQFSAAHSLKPPYSGKCELMHGHNYTVEVRLKCEILTPEGMVMDFAHLAPLKTYIAQKMDHGCLNHLLEQTTVEHIARHLFDWCKDRGWFVEKVRVWETDGCWGEYSRG